MKNILGIFLLFLVSTTAISETLLVTNANGYTLDAEGKLLQFQSMLVKDGRVVSLDPRKEEIPSIIDKTIDVEEKTLLPGLIDAHGHLLGLGGILLKVDIRDMPSAKDAAKKVSDYARKNQDLPWITGGGWNQVLWPGKEFPTVTALDEYINDRPVWLKRVDGHAGWANSKALNIAGIDKDSLDPPGGKIVKDEKGQPTGVLIDNAMGLLEQHIPEADERFYKASLEAAGKHLLALGVTSMHDAGISQTVYEFYKKQTEAGQMPVRVYAMIAATDPNLVELLKAGYVDDKTDLLSIRSVKAYGDGALGSRGAAMLKPYDDDPKNRGLLVTREEALKELFDTVLGHGFQLNFHAIGDRANRLALDQYEDTFERIGGRELRHRIEHSQVVNVNDIPRFKTLDIIPSMQPTHATSDMNMAQARVGFARLKGAYAWRTFLDQGSRIAFGSDFPVELANPFFGLHAAVTRQDRKNQPREGWIPDEAVTVVEAFKGFTLDAAHASHQEDVLGLLQPGFWADFIIIDRDIFAGDRKDIWKTNVLSTFLAGDKVSG